MNKTLIVAKDTYRREVKSWSFLLMVLSPFIFAIITIGIGFLTASNSDNSSYIGVVTTDKVLKREVNNSDDFEAYKSLKSAKKDYKSDDIDGYVEISESNGRLQATYHGDDTLDNDLKSELTGILNTVQRNLNLSQARLSAEQAKALSTQPKLVQKVSKDSDSGGDADSSKMAAFFILVMIMYLFVLAYTQTTAQDIATEKGTKVMEMIFSSMPGKSYFDGKILGIISEIVTQAVIYIAGGAIFYFAAPHIDGISDVFKDMKPMIDQTLANVVSWGLVFVVLGLVLYVVCAAFCGALASKPEDANKAVQPVTYLTIIGFIAALALQNTPDTIVAKVLSYVPFLSSFIMPLRVINGDASNLEAGISAIILLAFTVGLFIVIRNIYPNLILQTDDLSFVSNFKRALKSR